MDFWKSWKFWAAVVAIALVITAVVLCFVYPVFGYAVGAFFVGGLAGFIWGYKVNKGKGKEEK